jgi:hypothetical protein
VLEGDAGEDGSDRSLEAPVEAPVEDPVEAPVEAAPAWTNSPFTQEYMDGS